MAMTVSPMVAAEKTGLSRIWTWPLPACGIGVSGLGQFQFTIRRGPQKSSRRRCIMYAIPCQGASLCWSLAHDISALWQQPENNGGRRTISQIRLRIWNLCGMEQAVKTEEVINTQTPRDAECPRPRGPVGFLPHSAPFLLTPRKIT